MDNNTLIPIEDLVTSAPVSDIFTLLDQVARKLREIQRLTVSEVDLTPPQFQTLRLLWEHDGQPFKDLADANGCTRPTMTGIVDTLEKNGLVTRQPNPDDRRSLLGTGRQHPGPGPYLCQVLCGVECRGVPAVGFTA